MAQSVALTGVLGTKALLVVDGATPRAVPVGEVHRGVKVLSLTGDEAVVEIGGRRQALRLGDVPTSVGAAGSSGGGRRIVLSADGGGHFMGNGSINGRAVRFMVDTGASTVGLSLNDAERLGLDYRAGQPTRVGTANGTTAGWRLKLASVRVGDVEVHEIDAIVTAQPMPFVLLGNSFLNRFQMRRDNEQMVLEKRF